MEILELQCLVEVLRCKSFTAAADTLFLSQPTISKKIQSLEAELGVTLISRRKNAIEPTPAGGYLMSQAQEIIALSQSVMEQTKRIGAGFIGSLRLGISDQLDINGIIPGFLKEFMEANPQISVSLQIYPLYSLAQMMQCDKLDAAFLPITGDRMCGIGLSHIPINRSSPKLYFSSLHPKARRRNLTAEDFIDCPFLTLHSETTETRKRLKAMGLDFPKIVVLESMQVLKLYLEADLGVAVLGSSQNLGSSDRIMSIPMPIPDFLVGTDCIYNAASSNPSIERFISALKHYLKLP